jgi:hypothetical protein
MNVYRMQQAAADAKALHEVVCEAINQRVERGMDRELAAGIVLHQLPVSMLRRLATYHDNGEDVVIIRTGRKAYLVFELTEVYRKGTAVLK